MNVYLVGGALRDTLLGLPVKEKDWVVVGATPEIMLEQGFQPVGKEFPVFLHPKTHEEYALARTERKISKGYKGFTFYTAPDVTLEQDLLRRDLTINAIAQSVDGKLIDPYGGQTDLKTKCLRHVSPAFAEDPVRILRVARFAAKLPDFDVFPETNQLMRHMVQNGEVNALVAERVWQECSRALMETAPRRFFSVLADCGALTICFPGIQMEGEGMRALTAAAELATNLDIRLAVALHDLSYEQIQYLSMRLRIPKQSLQLALLVQQYCDDYTKANNMAANACWHLLKSTDAMRRPHRFHEFLTACAIITGNNENQCLLENAAIAMKNIDTQPLQLQKLKGNDFANALQKMQISVIEKLMK